ncbi:hypothetical protein C8P68_1128 [Mucilaginibacter yixingensis]|uniref:Uncharacterized protein n=1 Tax=Mucilaginibacter yixingensis TaxID=1295612 RepID=A0A2T5J4G9_9SPHI|nr:hypothetical protein [Mucilaginibacter yixingensis]PTQ92408.1 hypothetical protein C8P68_1128 [Mucilaginibacter yixingensis]
MNEPFILEVSYQNKALEFPAAFQRYGYTYRIAVAISDENYVFELDEEGNYRVLNSNHNNQQAPDPGLLEAIAGKLKRLQ